MTELVTGRIVVPLASEDDTIRTIGVIVERVDPVDSQLRFVHVIEKAGGAPDKAPLPAREEQAERIFDIVGEHVSGTDYDVETELRYGTDVLGEILAAAEEVNATAIAFIPRPGGRISALLSGNLTNRLVSNDRFPVVVFPKPDDGTA